MEAILHIGTEKTGSTTIQASLQRDRDRLAREGVLFPRSVGSRHHRRLQLMAAGADALGDPWLRMKGITTDRALEAALADWRRDLARELDDARRSGIARVVFSSEHLQSRLGSVEQVGRLRALLEVLGLGPVRVVVYLREQVAAAVSLLSTRVLMGDTLAEPPDPDTPLWGIVLDHRATLERWGSVFGEDALVVRRFEREAFVGGDLLLDWSEAAGLPGPTGPSPERRNESVSALAIELVRRINLQRPAPPDESADPVRASVVAAVTRATGGLPGFVPRPELAETYRRRFAEGNEWVRRTRFPELPALFGATAPGGPARPSDRSWDDAELDALASAILELAERAVPGEPAPRRGRRRAFWPAARRRP